MQLLPSHRRWPINETQIESDTRLHSCSDWGWAGFCNNHHSRRNPTTQSAENKTAAARRFRSPLVVVGPSDLSGDATIAVAVLGRLLLLHPAASGGAVECNNNCRKDNRTKKFQHLLRPIVVGWAKTLYLFVARRWFDSPTPAAVLAPHLNKMHTLRTDCKWGGQRDEVEEMRTIAELWRLT